ncbi:MAG: ATP-binding protein [Desulfonatronovibrionaceae bacterium]
MPEDNKSFTWVHFPANRPQMDSALEKVSKELADEDTDPEQCSKIRLILEEIMLNIVRHAYQGATTGPVHVGWRVNRDGSRTIRFVDSGEEFNPLQKDPPDTEIPLEDRQIGGLGIHLVRELSQGVEYTRENDENILTVHI